MAIDRDVVCAAAKSVDAVSTDTLINILDEIVPLLKSRLTSAYLQKKIDALRNETDESEIEIKCAALKPYLDWYVQGLQSSKR